MQCSQYGTGNKTQFILLFLLSSGSKRITPLSGALITSYSTGLHQTSLPDAHVLVFMCVALYALLLRSMKRARDIRDQLEGLMERVEIDVKSNILDSVAIRKVGVVLVYDAHA